ncbi:DUF4245 domain-containing protein [Streptomyces sp. V2]|uniref:DUF4245 domain-containing protein n=1 Tax=unclassified Streptomyces TaxID=2593676 RepID=UPI000D66E734|nr:MULTISPECIES: DUF4245 domain-containing protein [unclassified Streptomyces]PWG14672.1 DUF4245 domain-containing protein [Streptomyces sp. V2]QZZ29951.1 DUF4245 domain-containing protein [Streptomyces sp. ST1015]
MAGSNGKQKSARDMILSLGLIVAAALVIYLFIPHDDGEPDLKRVDYTVELATARRAASYPVTAPVGLPDTWKATSVRFNGADSDAWHLGFRAPDGQYVQVEQSASAKRDQFVDDASQGSTATDVTDEIGGAKWTRWTGGRYDALVLNGADGSTTVVAGTASFDRLAEMARALKTA